MRRAFVGLLLVVVLLSIPGVLAHAIVNPNLAEPAPQQRYLSAPTELDIVFTESLYTTPCVADLPAPNVQCTAVQIWRDGQRIPIGELQIQSQGPPRITATLPTLEPGAYQVRWQTYSQTDGHVVGASYGFSIGNFDPPADTIADDRPDPLGVVYRALGYAGLTLLAGALLMRSVVQPDASLRSLRWGGLLVAAAAIVELAFATTERSILTTPQGADALFRLLLALGIVFLHGIWGIRQRIGGLQLGVLGAATTLIAWRYAQYGHAGAVWSDFQGMQFLHIFAIAGWLGLLVQLLDPVRTKTLGSVQWHRFSPTAAVLAILSFVTGAVLSGVILQPPSLLFSGNAWSWSLIVKLLAFGIMAVLAWRNRALVLGRKSEHAGRSIRIEAVAGAVAILMGAIMLSSGAPVDVPEDRSLYLTDSSRDAEAVLTFEPLGLEEPMTLEFQVNARGESDFEPVNGNTCAEDRDDCMLMRIGRAADGAAAPETFVLAQEGPGTWVASNVILFEPGVYTVELEINTGFLYREVLTFEFEMME